VVPALPSISRNRRSVELPDIKPQTSTLSTIQRLPSTWLRFVSRLTTKRRKMWKRKREEYLRYTLTSPLSSVSVSLSNIMIVRRCDTAQHRIRRTSHQPSRRAFREPNLRPDRHPEGRSANSSLAWEGNLWIYITLCWIRAHSCREPRIGTTRQTRLVRRLLPAPTRQLLSTVWKASRCAVLEFPATVVEKI